MNQEPEIIDLDASSEEADNGPLLEFADLIPEALFQSNNLAAASAALDPQSLYAECLRAVTECFPDISHDHVQKLYSEYIGSIEFNQAEGAPEVLIGRILDAKTYPKEKDRLSDLKRKRSSEHTDDDAEAAKWKANVSEIQLTAYNKISRAALQDTFPMVPLRYIDARLKEHGNLYGTYLDVADTERRYDHIISKPYTKLKARRHNHGPNHDDFIRRIRSKEGAKGEKLEQELLAAHERKLRDDNNFEIEIRKQAIAIAREQDERDRGEVIECGCCFDSIPMSKVTQCNAEIAHFFCFDCAKMNAETDIGLNRFALKCMDGSGCTATFNKIERAKFIDDRTIAKLESLEQQASIQGAMSEFFDFVTCPFCQYGHICPPVEEDREFRCGYPECREISCRLCKERTHVPMTCEEYRKEQGISERHLIEEARTEALLRTCPKCKVRILKEDGCNKVVCTTCRSAICDYCGKDITSEQYAHFEGQGRHASTVKDSGKCALYDQSTDRKDKQIGAAEQKAKESIRKENPEISEEDLEIKFSKEVTKSESGSGYMGNRYPRAHLHHGQIPPYVPRNRFHAARVPVRHGGHMLPLDPLAPIRAFEPQHPRLELFQQRLQELNQMHAPDQLPHDRIARDVRPIAPLHQQQQNRMRDLANLEEEALVRRRRIRELHQEQLMRLQEQQAQTARELEAQANALRDALPAFVPPPLPQVQIPVRNHNQFPFYAPQAIGIPQPTNLEPLLLQQPPNIAGQWPPWQEIAGQDRPQPDPNLPQGNLQAGFQRNRIRPHVLHE